MTKKLGSLILGIAVLFGLAACTDLGTEVSGYYVAVDINPSIEFVVDGDDNVESYVFLNEDAEILCVDLDFVGMNIDDAVELFIQTATDAGYIDPEGDDNAVLITVLGEENEDEVISQIRERIRERIVRHFAASYINALVLSDDFTQEDLVLEAQELGVTPGKLKLSYAAIAGDETLVLDDLLNMPVKDILALVKEVHQEEWDSYKESRLEQLRTRKQDMIQEHKAEVEAYIAEHPEMTQEEIDAYIEEYKAEVRVTTMNEWQERREEWINNRQNSNNPN